MILEIKNLSFSYGEKNIAKNLSFCLKENQILGVCGKNGSGKTSLCNAIAVIDENNFIVEGEINFGNKSIRDMSIGERCQTVGIIFQQSENQFFSPFVEDELAFAPENLLLSREEIQNRIAFALEKCGIEHLRKEEIANLSGGEKQLVAIASVLTMRPKILLADEITSNLDAKKKELIRKLLIYYSQNIGSVVFVAHSKEDKDICDKIVNLSEGEI